MNRNSGSFRSILLVLVLCTGALGLTSFGRPGGISPGTLVEAATCPAGKVLLRGTCVDSNATITAHVLALARQSMAQQGLKAAILGVWIGKKKLFTRAMGESMTGVPATTRMHFRIGSVAIAYLDTLLLQLVDRGRVRLDDKLSTWLPSLPHADSITLRMLATTSSGYADYVTDPAFIKAFYANVFRHWSQQELLQYAFSHPLRNTPGSRLSYAHTNFIVLGMVLSKITGQPVARLMRDRILRPLGLRNTDSPSTPAIRQPVLHSYDSERGKYEESTYWSPSWTLATGAIMTSNIDDLGKSAIAVGRGTLLSPASHRAQIAPAYRISAPGQPPAYYGMGVARVDPWILQNPSFGGYTAVMAYLPSRHIAIAIASTKGEKANPEANSSVVMFQAVSRYLASTGLAAPAPKAGAQRLSPETRQRLNRAFARYLRVMKVSGGVARIEIPGRGSWQVAGGMADAATGRRMSLADHMRLGSITKSFTITAILQLMDQGKLSLDDPIGKYIPEVPNGQNISLRLLGNMRSGLFNYSEDQTWQELFVRDPYAPWTPERLLSYAWPHKPYFPPNQGFHYSNTNTVLLGLVVEKVSGQSLAAYFRQHIFKPLGMTHTVMPAGAAIPAPYAHGFTNQTASGQVADATHWNPSWGWAAGAIISTVRDLAIWAHAVGTGALLSPGAQQERLHFVPVAPGQPGGYGLAVGSKHGWILHNGNLPGYSSYFGYLPALHAVMAISLTSDIRYEKTPPADIMANVLSQIAMPNHSMAGQATGNP